MNHLTLQVLPELYLYVLQSSSASARGVGESVNQLVRESVIRLLLAVGRKIVI